MPPRKVDPIVKARKILNYQLERCANKRRSVLLDQLANRISVEHLERLDPELAKEVDEHMKNILRRNGIDPDPPRIPSYLRTMNIPGFVSIRPLSNNRSLHEDV